MQWAADHGISITAHAGEAAGAPSVTETIRRLQPRRIGHGVRATEDPDAVELIKDSGIHLEVCPSSNLQTGIHEDPTSHPLDKLRRHDVSLSVATDCRAITDVSLAQEYDRVRGAFGWTSEHFFATDRAAIRAAFADDQTKQRLLDLLDSRQAAHISSEATARRLDLTPDPHIMKGQGRIDGPLG